MKFSALLFLCLLLSGCRQVATTAPQTLDYQVGNNEYAIVVIFNEGTSEQEAKQVALQKAAEKAHSEQFQYFTIEKEGPVAAILSGKDGDSSHPSNMYYDLRQSGDFGRERFSGEQMPQGTPQSAYQIIFKCYVDKPSGQAIDVCDVLSCKK